MSKKNILFKISGSIAAYKSADLISQLVKEGNEVQVVTTNSAKQFIGSATLEGLTGNPILSDLYNTGTMMAHIDYIKWADLTIFAPATANIINSMACGLANDLALSMFLAHDWKKPYIVAPAMNSKMLSHPATKKSIRILKDWGVIFLPTSEGVLACGDYGKGKMLEPKKIKEYLSLYLKNLNKKSVLITSGGTQEHIDAVRVFTNISTGHTASEIANQFQLLGWDVTYLYGENSLLPKKSYKNIPFSSALNLNNLLKKHLSTHHFDAIIHLAAISDYKPISIYKNGKCFDNKIKTPTAFE